jgi:hypothetical protein
MPKRPFYGDFRRRACAIVFIDIGPYQPVGCQIGCQPMPGVQAIGASARIWFGALEDANDSLQVGDSPPVSVEDGLDTRKA